MFWASHKKWWTVFGFANGRSTSFRNTLSFSGVDSNYVLVCKGWDAGFECIGAGVAVFIFIPVFEGRNIGGERFWIEPTGCMLEISCDDSEEVGR